MFAERLAILITSLISRIVGWFSRIQFPAAVQIFLIKVYCALYKVDSSTAALDISQYKSLAGFFTRDIKAALRPIGEGKLVSPVDGVLRSCGKIQAGLILDIKGQQYSVEELLSDSVWARTFANGYFYNFYLSPRDCHHVYCPLQAKISRISNISGTLWPVNALGLSLIPKLFVKNERMAFGLESANGPFALVMVGALNVGFLEALCVPGDSLQKGQKMGTFWLGSSVILICNEKIDGGNQAPRQVQFSQTILS